MSDTRTIVKKHERGVVRMLVTVLSIFGMIGGATFILIGIATIRAEPLGIGIFAFVFWLIMALIARPKTEIIQETVYSPSPRSDSQDNSNIGGFNN